MRSSDCSRKNSRSVDLAPLRASMLWSITRGKQKLRKRSRSMSGYWVADRDRIFGLPLNLFLDMVYCFTPESLSSATGDRRPATGVRRVVR